MSRQPGVTIAGTPLRAAASRRVGPAFKIPPTNSSAHSVVVMSNTPLTMPDSISDSIVRPPVPVAWNTSVSYPSASRILRACVTQSVVFPNWLATITGFASLCGGCASTIPQIAPAARDRICREMRFNPATSTMLGNITMSFTPTYCAVFPLANVDTITFGNPIGNARIAAVAIAVPPPPPREITPSIFFSVTSRDSTIGAPSDIAATASPRSRFATSAFKSFPAACATSKRVMSGFSCASSKMPTSIIKQLCPRLRICCATNACSCPLVSMVPRIAIVAIGQFFCVR